MMDYSVQRQHESPNLIYLESGHLCLTEEAEGRILKFNIAAAKQYKLDLASGKIKPYVHCRADTADEARQRKQKQRIAKRDARRESRRLAA